ncbi:MAG: thioredoxin family protein [Vicinamibacterales bacterium]
MRTQPISLALLLVCATALQAQQIDYSRVWDQATPFDQFLQGVKAREAQWKSRFANAAVEAQILTDVRGLTEKRRILVVAADTCSDSAWAVPYIAKLAAAVPERLELRVIGRKEGSRIQAAHLTPDGRLATPTIVVLDEHHRALGAWVERPAELQKWVISNRASVSADALHEHIDNWQKDDAGKTTVREIVAVLKNSAAPGGK